jgi:hypothetical protein
MAMFAQSAINTKTCGSWLASNEASTPDINAA